RLRRGRPDVVDAEPDEGPPQRAGLRTFDCVDEQLCRTRPDAFERHELLHGQAVHVGRVFEQARVDELADAFLSQSLDVHGAAAGPVHEALHPLGRAVDVDAVVVGLTLDTHERLTTYRALGRELPAAGALRALGQHRPDDLGDDVAGA